MAGRLLGGFRPLLIAGLVAFLPPLLCLGSEPDSHRTWAEKMEGFYLEKDAAFLAEFWDRTIGRGALTKLPESQEMMIGFFGAALRGHPEILCSRIRTLYDFEGVERDLVSLILWWSDMDCSRRLLRGAGLTEMADTTVPPVASRRIYGIDDPHFLMGWFYATGDTDALTPMISHVIAADWDDADHKVIACGSVLRVLSEKDERVRAVIEGVLDRTDLSEVACKVFLFALGKINAEPKE